MFITQILNKLRRCKKLAIYTAIIGEYDTLKNPLYIDKNCDYICFTDNINVKSEIWEIIHVEKDNNLDDVKNARKIKILAHKYLFKYEQSIWIDGSYEIIGSVREYISKYSVNNPMLCLIHPQRHCIYDEANTCISIKKDDEKIISNVIKKYKHENYPPNNGLIASGILYRKHKDFRVINIMEEWWNEVEKFSRRDQLSFNYVCWKKNFYYDEADIDCFKNKYALIYNHIK